MVLKICWEEFMDNNRISEQKSIAGLRANAAAFLVNLSFFTIIGGLIVPIFALILEDKNSFVRSYAKQTLAIWVLLIVSGVLNFIIIIGNILYFIIFIVLAILQIIATISSILEKEFKIPYVEKIINLLFLH
jgi:hypothetical protein